MYKSENSKIDPYDWFCGPRSHMIFKSCSDDYMYLFVRLCITQYFNYMQKLNNQSLLINQWHNQWWAD